MSSQIQKVIRWFYRQSFIEGELRFEDQLLECARKVLDKNPVDAEAFVYSNLTHYWNELCKHSDEDVSRGLRPLFLITDRVSKKATWYPRLDRINLHKGKKRAIIRSKSRPTILKQIDALNNREYEALGYCVAELLGGERNLLTPPGNEGGIDFFSQLKVPAICHIFGGRGTPVRIVGQSKKYSNRVSDDKVKEFAFTIEDIRREASRVKDLVPTWFKAAHGPIIGWIIAHNGFQSGAQTRARNHGIVTSNSIDLAEVVAQSRLFFEELSAEDRASQLKNRVRSILDTTSP